MAVFVFLIIFIIFIGIISTLTDKQSKRELAEQSEFITSLVSSEKSFAFIQDNKITKQNLQELLVKDMQELRTLFGVTDDFCIYFEDADGNLIPIEDTSGQTYNGIGSSDAIINDIPCGVEGAYIP